jgi:cyclohexyl-isocyanide hydratase
MTAARLGGAAPRPHGHDALGINASPTLFGAIPVNERVVVDGKFVFAAGVTAGIDGALRVAADLRGAI